MTEPTPITARVVPRPFRESDRGYILSSWARTWSNSQDARRLPSRAFHALFQDLVVRGVLADDSVRFLVVGMEEDVDAIAGWICYTPGAVPTVHYAYVRKHVPAPEGTDLRDMKPLRRSGTFEAMIHLAGVRDSLVYTFRPAERAHPRDNRTLGVENALLDAARRRQIHAVYRPVEEFLGRSRGR